MKSKKKRLTVGTVVSFALGVACALVLSALFYGAMAYQLAGEETTATKEGAPRVTAAPLVQGVGATLLYPGALLGLADAQLTGETAQDAQMGGATCRVMTRSYRLADGETVQAVSAYPAAYLEWMAQNGYVSQLVTGFTLAGMDAVYAVGDDGALLCAGEGDCVYMLLAPVDEQRIYALGAAAYLE